MLDDAVRRNAKELVVLTGENPAVNAEVALLLRSCGRGSFVDYVVWTCERTLERGLLAHNERGRRVAPRSSSSCAR